MPKGVYQRKRGVARPWQRNRQITKCLNCATEIEDAISCARKFCSQKCSITFRRGPNIGVQYKTDEQLKGTRHRMTTLHGVVLAEHRRIAEKALGRPLSFDECVHHIDADKRNNTRTNLLICSRAYHQWLHHEMSVRYAKEHFGGFISGVTK